LDFSVSTDKKFMQNAVIKYESLDAVKPYFKKQKNPTGDQLFRSHDNYHRVVRHDDTAVWDREPTWDMTYDPDKMGEFVLLH
jgi:hypothetical protein